MPISIWISIVCIVLALVGMLIFGGCMIIVMMILGGGTVFALISQKDGTERKHVDLNKRKGLIGRFGIGVVSVAMVGVSGFGLAFASMIGFILSMVVNMVIWIPAIFNSFG